MNVPARAISYGFLATLVLIYSAKIILLMRSNIADPPEWDFKLYWLYGQALAQGLSPYQHTNLLRIAQPLNPKQRIPI